MQEGRLGLGHEIQRKSIHLLTSVVPLALYFGADNKTVLYFSLVLSIGFLTADLLRMNFNLAKKYFLLLFSSLLRVDERGNRLTGATYLFLGMTATFYLFPKEAAVPAVLFLTVADPLAAIIGKQFGSGQYFGKTIEGSLGFYLAASAVIILFTSYSWLGLGVALFAAAIEFLPIGINDNLLIPIISGYLLYALG